LKVISASDGVVPDIVVRTGSALVEPVAWAKELFGVGAGLRRVWTLLASGVLFIPGLLVLGSHSAQAVENGSLSAQTSHSWQTNATVWDMAYGPAYNGKPGDIWMVGDFTKLRPPFQSPGVRDQTAEYFSALIASTGAPDPAVDDTHSFTGQPPGTLPLTKGAVAVSPNGAVVYVGGDFTAVDGQPRAHLAAFDTATGALLPWNPGVRGRVRAIATSGDVVYVGGSFSQVGATVVGRDIAAISASTGQAFVWGAGPQPSTNDTVDAIAVTSDGSQVVAGGYFDQVDGLKSSADQQTIYNKAVIIGGVTSTRPGVLEPMPADVEAVPPGVVTDPVNGCSSDVKDVVISAGYAYLANEGTGVGCFDGTWAVSLRDGSLKWVNRCLGATQAVAVVGSFLYKGSHEHNCREDNLNGDPNAFGQLLKSQSRHVSSEFLSNGFIGPWNPDMNAGPNLGPRTMATDGQQLYVGGDFTKVNGVGQQGVARFTATTDYPTPTPRAPQVSSPRTGVVVVTATPPVDPDDPDLVMELFRNGAPTPVASTAVESLFWRQPKVRWVLSGQRAGQTDRFRVRAVERYGTGASPLSTLTQVAVDCGRSEAVRAAIVAADVSRGRNHHRRVSVAVCSVNATGMRVEVRRGAQVLAHATVRHLHAGQVNTRLTIANKVPKGAIRAYVVFSRGARHKVEDRRLFLPR
jgi:large repetitive protein